MLDLEKYPHEAIGKHSYVLYTDYASLLERCERMEKALHVVDIVRISAEALAAKEEGNV
jgi:hypothetical protein